MAEFTVNALQRQGQPYPNFQFLVYWAGQTTPVAGVSRVSALSRTTAVIEHNHGGNASAPMKTPGRTTYEPITLEQGRTHDAAFERWANKVWNYGSELGTEVSLRDFRKDIIIELLNEAGQPVLRYNVYRCWVSQYQALPELDATGNAVAIQTMRLENEGWERDYDLPEPAEPSFEEPPA
jgi:phage tail-like protein